MNKHIKTLALAGALSAFCLIPLSSAEAGDSGRHERRHTQKHYNKKPQRHAYNHDKYHYYKNRADYHRALAQLARKDRHKFRHKRVVVHKRGPNKIVHVYNKYDHRDRTDDLIAIALAQTAILLALD